jgi:hypothetical protein
MAQNSTAEIERAQLQRVELLKALYDLSNRSVYQTIMLQEAAEKVGIKDYQEAIAIASYLDSKGLFDFDGGGWTGRMTTSGIDMVEKWRTPKPKPETPKVAPSFHYEDKSVRVLGSSFVQAGSNNTQTVKQDFQANIEQIFKAIDGSDASQESKDEAKSLLGSFLKHPLVTSIAGGLASTIKPPC